MPAHSKPHPLMEVGYRVSVSGQASLHMYTSVLNISGSQRVSRHCLDPSGRHPDSCDCTACCCSLRTVREMGAMLADIHAKK